CAKTAPYWYFDVW
nr:immunoglobulin heavy chain junction region [Mus musculus]